MKEKGFGIHEDFNCKIRLTKQQRDNYRSIREKLRTFKTMYDGCIKNLITTRNKLFALNREMDKLNWYINF